MPRIDLHTHSRASDGTTTPADLVREAAAAGLDVVALTDHDTTAGWDEAAQALSPGVRLVRGAEISCVADGISLHLLAYLFDPHDAALAARLAQVRASRDGRARAMVDALAADGHPVSWDQVEALAGGTVGRPHVGQALVDAGLVRDLDEAFTPDWIGTRGRYWVGKQDLPVLEAIALVRAAGGRTVFAHPGASARGRTVGDDVVAAMAAAGLDGLEVDHVDHTQDAREHLRRLAAELDLLVTGASDFHGERKTVRLGENLTTEQAFEALVSRPTALEVL